jgi:hypothetical protein
MDPKAKKGIKQTRKRKTRMTILNTAKNNLNPGLNFKGKSPIISSYDSYDR